MPGGNGIYSQKSKVFTSEKPGENQEKSWLDNTTCLNCESIVGNSIFQPSCDEVLLSTVLIMSRYVA